MSVNEFMADFMIAGADYYRMDDAVHNYLEASDGMNAAAKIECIRQISDCIEKCKESIANAQESAGGILLRDLHNDQVRDDVTAAFGLVAYWDSRVSTLFSMMRTIALDTDADCIELLARSRDNADARSERPGRTLDIADPDEPDGIELFSEYPDEEDDVEDESEDYSDEDATDEESEGEIVGDADPDEDAEVVDGWMPSDIPTNSTAVREAEPVDDDSAEVFIAHTAKPISDEGSAQIVEPIVMEAPAEKPLTREEIQSIVLETMKEFFAQTAPVAPQDEEKPKKTSRRKSTAAKSPISRIRRKKAEEKAEEETVEESPEVDE